MPYIPAIRDYKPLYIQAAGDAQAWDTTIYGLVAQTQPFPVNVEVKEPYKNTWFDEHGDEEYVGGTMYRKSFEYTVKFFVKTYTSGNSSAIERLNSQINDFLARLLLGEFKIWDSWQERGFQNVRYVKNSVEDRDVTDESAWMLFSVTMKVNDPATMMTLDNGQIVTA